MNTERLQRILQKLKEKNLSQMIISDPLAIYYLTGRLIDPGERLLALYIRQSGNNRIFINNLFTVPEDLGVEKVRFSDTDDSIALLAEALTPGEALGIDKIFPARIFLCAQLCMRGRGSRLQGRGRERKDESQLPGKRRRNGSFPRDGS